MVNITQAPTVHTPRLILTAHSRETFAALSAMWADPEVVRHIGGTPSTANASWMRMLSYCGCWQVCGFGYWAVLERSSGRYIGDVGFADFHRDLEVPIIGIPEAGWALAAWAKGQGFATEALRAAFTWLDERTPHRRSVCFISPDNTASVRVAEKVGFGEPKLVRYNDRPVVLFARERPE